MTNKPLEVNISRTKIRRQKVSDIFQFFPKFCKVQVIGRVLTHMLGSLPFAEYACIGKAEPFNDGTPQGQFNTRLQVSTLKYTLTMIKSLLYFSPLSNQRKSPQYFHSVILQGQSVKAHFCFTTASSFWVHGHVHFNFVHLYKSYPKMIRFPVSKNHCAIFL